MTRTPAEIMDARMLDMLITMSGQIGRLDTKVDALAEDLGEVKDQTSETNGHVADAFKEINELKRLNERRSGSDDEKQRSVGRQQAIRMALFVAALGIAGIVAGDLFAHYVLRVR